MFLKYRLIISKALYGLNPQQEAICFEAEVGQSADHEGTSQASHRLRVDCANKSRLALEKAQFTFYGQAASQALSIKVALIGCHSSKDQTSMSFILVCPESGLPLKQLPRMGGFKERKYMPM